VGLFGKDLLPAPLQHFTMTVERSLYRLLAVPPLLRRNERQDNSSPGRSDATTRIATYNRLS